VVHRTQIADFAIGDVCCITALYVTGPDILALDDPALRGIPFLFYTGYTRHSAVLKMQGLGVHYGGLSEWRHIITPATRDGDVPEWITLPNGEAIHQSKLFTRMDGKIHVPYACVGMEDPDPRAPEKVRKKEDFTRMIHEILPGVNSQRRREKSPRLWTRFVSRFV
jgi:hypothetical protein